MSDTTTWPIPETHTPPTDPDPQLAALLAEEEQIAQRTANANPNRPDWVQRTLDSLARHREEDADTVRRIKATEGRIARLRADLAEAELDLDALNGLHGVLTLYIKTGEHKTGTKPARTPRAARKAKDAGQ